MINISKMEYMKTSKMFKFSVQLINQGNIITMANILLRNSVVFKTFQISHTISK